MEGNAHALHGVLQGDELALGMAGGQGLLCGVAVKRLGDLVDGLGVDLGVGHQLRTHGQGLHGGHVLVGVGGDGVHREIGVGHAQAVRLRAGERHEFDAGAAGGQLGNGAGGRAADEEEGVERAVLELVAGLVGLDVFGLEVGFLDAIGGQHHARVDERARARLVERDALALEVGHALDARALLDDEVDALGVEVGDHAQVADLGLALEGAGAGVGPGGHVGLREARLDGAAGHGVDVGQRAVGGLRRGNELARLRHGVGDHAAHGVVGAGGAAGADAEELLGECGRGAQAGGEQHGGGGGEGTALHGMVSCDE